MFNNYIISATVFAISYDQYFCYRNGPIGLLQYSQLVWLAQPLLDPLTSPWTLSVLKDSACDMNLNLRQVEDSSRNVWDIVYTTGLRTHKLAFFWAENTLGNPGSWDNPDQVVTVPQFKLLEL